MPQRDYHREDAVWHIKNESYPCYIRHDILTQLLGRWESHPKAYITEADLGNVVPWIHCRKHSATIYGEGEAPYQFHPDDPLEEHGPEMPIEMCYPKLICKFGSGFSALLQMAMIEGYNPIYTVGTDLGFKSYEAMGPDRKPADPNHFDPDYYADNTSTEKQVAATNAGLVHMHGMAKKMADAMGIQIFNATKGGELEVYPRVDYDGLF